MKAMGLNKLSKEKRNELILVVLVTVCILGGLGFGLIKHQYNVLSQLATDRVLASSKLDRMRQMVKRAPETKEELGHATKLLEKLEQDMAPRDTYLWFITTLRSFKQSYHVDIPQVSQPTRGDVTLLPKFPYQQATFNVAGTARFYELGRFLADLENKFPHLRVINLDVGPASGSSDRETLAFRMDVAVLLRPDAS